MGRPPCCDKVGVKKGPWTPEEDLMLVSYIQEHGPSNWRAVPTNTGLRRCSKSCRLRWTNYLRPGIKRGDFTPDEEKMIIQLQDLLGNKWAAIASYLPERTDNDIKNYWNTHLKKKLKKVHPSSDHIDGQQTCSSSKDDNDHHVPKVSSSSHSISRGQWERRLQTDIHQAKQALSDALSLDQKALITPPPPQPKLNQSAASTLYASSTENIAKLLKNWTKHSPSTQTLSCSSTTTTSNNDDQYYFNKIINADHSTCSEGTDESKICSNAHGNIDLSNAFESLFGFDLSFDQSNSNLSNSDFSTKSHHNMSPEDASTNVVFHGEIKPEPTSFVPFSVFENWLLDENAAAVCSWEK